MPGNYEASPRSTGLPQLLLRSRGSLPADAGVMHAGTALQAGSAVLAAHADDKLQPARAAMMDVRIGMAGACRLAAAHVKLWLPL